MYIYKILFTFGSAFLTHSYLDSMLNFDVFNVQIVDIQIFESVSQNAFHCVSQRKVG